MPGNSKTRPSRSYRAESAFDQITFGATPVLREHLVPQQGCLTRQPEVGYIRRDRFESFALYEQGDRYALTTSCNGTTTSPGPSPPCTPRSAPTISPSNKVSAPCSTPVRTGCSPRSACTRPEGCWKRGARRDGGLPCRVPASLDASARHSTAPAAGRLRRSSHRRTRPMGSAPTFAVRPATSKFRSLAGHSPPRSPDCDLGAWIHRAPHPRRGARGVGPPPP